MTGMSTVNTRNTYREAAVTTKIVVLLPVFEAHLAMRLGPAGTFHPIVDLDDARVLLANAEATLKGERTTITFTDKNGAARTKETYVLWNKVADLAGLPLPRYPSVSTIRALVTHLRIRVTGMETTPNPIPVAS